MLTLDRLRVLDVDRGQADRIRERCHRALVRPAPGRAAMVRSRLVESAFVAGISGVYLAEVLRRALTLYGS
jgi:hypothetical protein